MRPGGAINHPGGRPEKELFLSVALLAQNSPLSLFHRSAKINSFSTVKLVIDVYYNTSYLCYVARSGLVRMLPRKGSLEAGSLLI